MSSVTYLITLDLLVKIQVRPIIIILCVYNIINCKLFAEVPDTGAIIAILILLIICVVIVIIVIIIIIVYRIWKSFQY